MSQNKAPSKFFILILLAFLGVFATPAGAQPAPVRTFTDKASWVQLDLPMSWFAPRYKVTTLSGPQAAERMRGAAYWLSFEYQPEARDAKPEPLLRMAVFPRATWERVGDSFARSGGDLLAQNDKIGRAHV